MRRWLKIARAELVRDITLSLRYPMELGTGLMVMYLLFMGIYVGGRQMSGGVDLGGIEGTLVGFTMLFFALMALNTMSIDIENEARQGTLEQVFLCAPSFLGLLWVRALVHLGIGSLAVLLLSLAIQASTGRFLRLEPGEFLPMPWLDPKAPAAEPGAADPSPSQAEPAAAGSAPSSLPAEHTSGTGRGPTPGQASTPRRIVIPATTLAEFLAGAVASHGSLHRAADGIGVPYSTLRGWLRRRNQSAQRPCLPKKAFSEHSPLARPDAPTLGCVPTTGFPRKPSFTLKPQP